MLYNKYRPQKFSEVVGQKDVVENLMSQSAKDKFFGVYILCGQYGSGKTTTARILAMAANCRHKDEHGNPCGECEDCRAIREGNSPDCQEIAAAVNTGVDKVREICETVSYRPISLRKKVYIIDEVQALSKAAFQAFLKMLEEPPAHAMFILATTDVGAIPPTVRSRSAVYYFKQLTQAEISAHVRKVSDLEKLTVSDDACDVIAKYSSGSMRNALSLLDMATQEGKATGEKVEKLLGVSTPDAVFSLIREVLNGDAAKVIQQTTALAEGGADLAVLVNDMLHIVADLTVASVSLKSVKGTEHYLSLLAETVVCGSSTRFSAIADELFKAKQQMAKNADLSVLIVTLVRLSRRSDVVTYSDAPGEEVAMLRETIKLLAEKVERLEGKLAEGNLAVVSAVTSPVEVSVVAEASVEGPEIVALESEAAEEPELVSEIPSETPEVVEELSEMEVVAALVEEVEEPVEVTVVKESESSFEDDFFSDFFSVEETADEKVEEPNTMAEETEEAEPEVPAEEEPMEEVMEVVPDEVMAEVPFEELPFPDVSVEDEVPFEDLSFPEEAGEAVVDGKLFQEPLIQAVLSCCKVTNVNDGGRPGVEISTEIPVVRKFLSICFDAYEKRGFDLSGVKIV